MKVCPNHEKEQRQDQKQETAFISFTNHFPLEISTIAQKEFAIFNDSYFI
jgi:hypothetical protein